LEEEVKKFRIPSKRHGKRTAEVLFGSAICFINGLFFTAEEDFGDTIPAHFERIQKFRIPSKNAGISGGRVLNPAILNRKRRVQ